MPAKYPSPDDSRYCDYLSNRGALKAFIRKYYLRNVLKHVLGKAIDFGCGAGTLLSRLPPGSAGFEINEACVDYCSGKGLRVSRYDPAAPGIELVYGELWAEVTPREKGNLRIESPEGEGYVEVIGTKFHVEYR